jgi:hypothetical protein
MIEKSPKRVPARKEKKPGPGWWKFPRESLKDPQQMSMATPVQKRPLSLSGFFIDRSNL